MNRIEIEIQPDESGTYRCNLNIDQDVSVPLDGPAATRHLHQIAAAVAAAEYDFALRDQTKALGMDDITAATFLSQIRAERAERTDEPVVPGLVFNPMVSALDGQPRLALQYHGNDVGRWEMSDAKEHMMAVLLALQVAQLDTSFLRALNRFGIEEGRARHVIHDLYNFRHDFQPRD